ncbi:DNA-3-methyladenine glycosylase I [Streptomyces sp. NPDC049577]|uniref:DNA-3-methyladenine glycosylase I n=1 Tax=Streptomyces sp. NPDC049577 TaxID=3155153 RepID=UPI00343CE9AD
MRKRGWKSGGPTTVFAFMQALGLINDYARGCTVRPEVQRIREEFDRPARAASEAGRTGSLR